MTLTREQAQGFVRQHSLADLRTLLLTGLLLGAAGRGAVGVYGNISRNIRRRKAREDTSGREILLPVKASAEQKPFPYPWWFVPSAMLGTPLAMYGGWAGMGKLMKTYRKRRDREELAKAKQEFETALGEEHQTKFSADLDALAETYARGELDESLEKIGTLLSSTERGIRSLWPAYLTLALLMAGTGGWLGWKLTGGRGAEAERIRAYQEAMRRRRIARPVSLVARPQVPSETPQDEEPDASEPAPLRKAAFNWGGLLRGVGKHMAMSVPSALAGGYLMTKSPFGRRYISSRAEDLFRDPKFMRQQIQRLMANPAVMSSVYQQMLPAIRQQMVQRHPWMGRLAQYFT